MDHAPRPTHNTAPTRDQESEHGSGKEAQFSSKRVSCLPSLTLKGQLVPSFPGHLTWMPPAQSPPQRSPSSWSSAHRAHPGTVVHLPLHSAHTPPESRHRKCRPRPRKPRSCWLWFPLRGGHNRSQGVVSPSQCCLESQRGQRASHR